ncbi:MAG TPA: hypothetical protein VIJ92_01880 [Ginsengibacter sp.]
MKPITSIEDFKKEASNKNGDYSDFFITLNFNLRSSKRILYDEESETFSVINEIDDSYQDDLSETQLADETLIVEAINKGALFKYDF